MTPAGTNLLLAHADATPAPSDVVTKSLRFEKSSTANLNQDNPSGADARQMTLSFWVKLVETPSADRKLFAFGGSAVGGTSQSEQEVIQKTDGKINVRTNVINTGVYSAYTTRVFRDFSSWYHIVIAWDTDQSVAADRMKFYVNNEQETLTGTFPSLNYNDRFGQTGTNVKNRIGCGVDGASAYGPSSSYMADIIRIDGQQLTPTSFAEEDATTGQWKPKAFVGVYGTAGFHLDFEDDTAIGNDVSGEGNDFTATNLAASDVVLDTPTDNFCTFNPLNAYSAIVGMLAEGNLRVTTATGASGYQMMSTMGVSSGKWYYEYRDDSPSSRNTGVGWVDSKQTPTGSGAGAINQNGAIFYHDYIYVNGGGASAGAQLDNGDIAGVALDADAGKIWFSLNGTWWDSQDPAAGSNAKYTASTNSDIWVPSFMDGNYGQGTVNYGQDGTFNGTETAQGNADGNGRGDFYYTPPTGFLALSTGNLPTPTIAKPSEHFSTKLWTATSTNPKVLDFPWSFATDGGLVWQKMRSSSGEHYLFDTVRGDDKALYSNTSNAEQGYGPSYYTQDFDASGDYSIQQDGVGNEVNYSGNTYVAWGWKKSATAGMDIVTWTGNDDGSGFSPAPQSVSHGLTVTPELIIAKSRTQNTFHNFNWVVWHKDLTSGNYLLLNGNGAETGWGDALVSSIGSSSVTFGSDASMSGEDLNADASFGSADDYVAYLFASVEGYSKVGKYVGSGVSGNFIYLGFRPQFLFYKHNASGHGWHMMDDEREPYNPLDTMQQANQSLADTASPDFDFLSNGFRIHDTTGPYNQSGEDYIFYAVAASPFKYASAR